MHPTFGTSSQLRQSYGNDATKVRTLDTLQVFLRGRGEETVLNTLPVFGGKILDLVELYVVVMRHGGYEVVTAQGLWPAIARLLGLPANDYTEKALGQTYRKILQSFEDYVRLAQGLPSSAAFAQRHQVQTHQAQKYPSQPLLTAAQAAEKRKRASLSAPAAPVVPPFKALQSDVEGAISMLLSQDWSQITRGINTLTKLSTESDKELSFENFTSLLPAVTATMDLVLPVARIAFDTQISSYVEGTLSRSELSWDARVGATPLVAHMMDQINSNAYELALLNFLRNMSIEPVNEMYIAHSATILRHVYVAMCNPTTEAASYAFDILAQTSRHVDITGRKRTENDMWLEDSFNHDKAILKLTANPDLSGASSAEYLVATWGVFAVAMRTLFRDEKELVIRSLDLLYRLTLVPENKSAFLRCPQEMLERFVELLCVTYTSTDPLAMHESEGPYGLRKGVASALPPPATGDFDDRVDTDVRDMAVDMIAQLCTFGPDMQGRLVGIPELLPLLRRLLRTKSGRADIPRVVATLFSQLLPIPGFHPLLALTQLDLVEAACEGNEIAADMACNSLRNVFVVPSWADMGNINAGMSIYADSAGMQGNS